MRVTRYIIKEILVTLFAVTAVLMFAFLSNQLVRYLSMAANGKLPGVYIFKLMLLVIPQLIGLLLPLGLFFAILSSLGRLYVDNEMTVLSACGFSRKRLIGIIVTFSAGVAVFVAILNTWLGPTIYADRQRLLKQNGSEVLLYLLMPGHFQSLGHDKKVVYVEDVARDRSQINTIFAAFPNETAKENENRWSILTAAGGHLNEDKSGERYFVVENGAVYQAAAGEKDYKISRFEKLSLRLTQNTPLDVQHIKAIPTAALFERKDNDAKAELVWRFSLPIMTIVLGFLAVPLSEVKPRQGQYAKMIPAGLLLIIYANLLFVSRGWISQGLLSPMIGMWWLHLSMILIAMGLLAYPSFSYHWRRRRI